MQISILLSGYATYILHNTKYLCIAFVEKIPICPFECLGRTLRITTPCSPYIMVSRIFVQRVSVQCTLGIILLLHVGIERFSV